MCSVDAEDMTTDISIRSFSKYICVLAVVLRACNILLGSGL